MRRRIRNETRGTITGHVGYVPNTVHQARRVLNYFLDNPKEQLTETALAFRCYIQGPSRELLLFLENIGVLLRSKDKNCTNMYHLNPAYRRFYKRHESRSICT